MWELDCEEGWVLKNWCFWIVVLEKTLESHLDCEEVQPVHLKGDQSWVFFGRTDAEAENPNTLATLCEELSHWKRLWCWEGLGAGRERGRPRMRWLDGITASMDMSLSKLGSWWWTGKPGVLQSTGSQKVRHDWMTELKKYFHMCTKLYVGRFHYIQCF